MQPNLGLWGPDKLYWPHPEESLNPCPITRSAGPQCMVARLVILRDICWVASDPAPALSLKLCQSDEHHLPPPGDWLRIYLMQFEYCQRLFQGLGLKGSQQVEAGRSKSWAASGLLLTCLPGLRMVKSGIGVQLGTSRTHLSPAKAAACNRNHIRHPLSIMIRNYKSITRKNLKNTQRQVG